MKLLNKYLKLFECCTCVKGSARSLIVDTQRSYYHFIPNDLYNIINNDLDQPLECIYRKYDEDNQQILNGYFEFLIEKEIAFLTDEPDNFPKISTEWVSPRNISNAIIDISIDFKYNYYKAIQEIDELGAEALQIRIFDKVEPVLFTNILNYIDTSTKRLKTVDLIIHFDCLLSEAEFETEMSRYQLVSQVIVHSSPYNKKIDELAIPISYVKEQVNDATHCGVIKPAYFSASLSTVLESADYNTCLNKKISIDIFGKIKNCPSMLHSYGTIDNTSLKEALDDISFRKMWSISKKEINICKDCEFRTICVDCRAYVEDLYEKPLKCKYNPYLAKWED